MDQPLLCDLPGWCQPVALVSVGFLLICGAEQHQGLPSCLDARHGEHKGKLVWWR